MALNLKHLQSNVFAGLGTYTFTVDVAGLYNMSCQASVLPPSGLSIVINHNGSPIATSLTPSAAEQLVSAMILDYPCVASDVITVVISSSNANDNMLNTAKSIINIGITI